MDKDRVKGKAKDIAGRAERQVGEWTGDEEKQIEGTKKQVRGKVQNAWGKMKDAGKKASKESEERDSQAARTRRKRDVA